LRILIVTQYFWPENFRINSLAKDLYSRGHDVTVYTGLPNYPEGKVFPGYRRFFCYTETYDGIEIKRVPMIPRGNATSFRLAINYLSFALSSSFSALFFLRSEYDVIFVYEPSPITVGIPAILLRKLKKIPILFWVQDLWPESLSATGAIQSKGLLDMVSGLVKYIYNRCDYILVQSNAFIEPIEKCGVNKNKIKYFPNSAEKIYKPIDPININLKLYLPEGFVVMFAGNIGVAQSIETIIKAALILKQYDSIKWVIIGDGRNKDWLKEQIITHQLDSTVYFLKQKPMEDMPGYFSTADVLLATLKNDPIFSLTIPSKVQSYLACAKPIIASIDGETARIIKESGGGLSVPAENAKELANAVLEMYQMTEKERINMGSNGRKYFEENYESERLVEQLEQWMSDSIKA